MNRRTILNVSAAALLGLTLLPANAFSQTLKQSIVGTWSYASVFDQYADGAKSSPWGDKPRGTLMFDANGRFAQILLGQPNAEMKTPDPRRPDTLTIAYFGTYTVDEGTKKISIKIEAAAYSGRSGTDLSWTVSGSGDKLGLVGSPRQDQKGTFSPHIELQRAK